MRALCLIRVRPGMVDNVTQILVRRKHDVTKEIMPVTGRADICVLLQSSIDKINTIMVDFNKIKNIVSTETLIELEVDMGW
uniref:Transcriptional regulator AsnC family n=1 Tax=uncultured marine thaumarchaeote KM3_59_E10 TaxID=1456211 RepID=A0A075HFD3_9ARCH|nr:hypothetical protein [uncultured marine thaumarchaeote KM3_59_E10]